MRKLCVPPRAPGGIITIDPGVHKVDRPQRCEPPIHVSLPSTCWANLPDVSVEHFLRTDLNPQLRGGQRAFGAGSNLRNEHQGMALDEFPVRRERLQPFDALFGEPVGHGDDPRLSVASRSNRRWRVSQQGEHRQDAVLAPRVKIGVASDQSAMRRADRAHLGVHSGISIAEPAGARDDPSPRVPSFESRQLPLDLLHHQEKRKRERLKRRRGGILCQE